MQSTLRQTVKVQAGGIVQVCLPDLPEGATAEVTVVVDTESTLPENDLTRFIGAAKGLYASPEEADAFIREERDKWHS